MVTFSKKDKVFTLRTVEVLLYDLSGQNSTRGIRISSSIRAEREPEPQSDLTEKCSSGKIPTGSQGICWGLFFLLNHLLPMVVLVLDQWYAVKCLINSSPRGKSHDL